MSSSDYDEDIYFGHLLRGDLSGALAYLDRFPRCRELRARYDELFAPKEPVAWTEPDDILRHYRRYYRDIFHLRSAPVEAEARLRDGLARAMGVTDPAVGIGELERGPISDLFRQYDLHFLGGRTGGYFGPYVWKDTEIAAYDVELPCGTRRFTVKLLDGFLSKSWLSYISFDCLSTGGWTGADGVIRCVRSYYDLESEDFRVSLLKHEAQHAWDLERRPDLFPTELEYRAKLVELIYSVERSLLPRFIQESGGRDGHASAAERIVSGFRDRLKRDAPDRLPLPLVRQTALELFRESERAVFSIE